MESCVENSLSNLPEKCKNLLSDIKDIIEVYPFMKDVISTYINSSSSNKWLSKNNTNFSCIKSSAEIQPINTKRKKKKIEMCKTLTNKNDSQCCVTQEFVSKPQYIDKKLCSKMPVVLLKRLSRAELPLNYIKYNGMKSSVNFSKSIEEHEGSCSTPNDLNITGVCLSNSEELSSDLLKESLIHTPSSNSKANNEILLSKKDAAPMENLLGHLTLDVYESDKDKMREEHFNLTKDYSSDEELDAISLYTNSIPGSDFEDDTSPKSNNFLDNSDHSCDAVGFKHSDEGQSDHEGQSDQQPEVPTTSVDALVQQNIHHGENSTENVCEESSQQFPTFKHVLSERNTETTFPTISVSNNNNKSDKSTSIYKKHFHHRIKTKNSSVEGCFSSGISENLQNEWFSGYCPLSLSKGTKCKRRRCMLSHLRPMITNADVEDLIGVVTFAKQMKFTHFLDYSLPILIIKTAKSEDCSHLYDILLKVLDICEYTGTEALDFILKTLYSSKSDIITEAFMDLFISTMLKCDFSANTWINFIQFSLNKVYNVPVNVLIEILNLCIDSSHKMLCSTVFEVFFQFPKYDLKEFPGDLIRKFADTLLNLKLDNDLSLHSLRLEATTESLQPNSLLQIESHKKEYTAICSLEKEMYSPEDILSPVRMKFFKEMSEHFSSDFCNIDSILPELVSESKNSELHEYYNILFMLKDDIKDKNFDNFIQILSDLQKIKHHLEIARELYVVWKSVHGFNSQPFFDLVSSANKRRNIVDFMELILTTIGVNIMLEKYFQSTWDDAYGVCKTLLDNFLNPASAQVCRKKIISPCNVVLISCEICMAVNDMTNAVRLIKENGMMAPSGWSVKPVEGDLMMRAEICQKLLELLILTHHYSFASMMMCLLWDAQSFCFDPIDLRKYCSPLICGLLSQNMGSESEKLYLLTKKNVKYDDITIRLLAVDAICRKKSLFARNVYAAGISLDVYPPITVRRPVSMNILSVWTAEEIQIALMIFFEKVAEFFKECNDVSEFNIVIHIKAVDVNYDIVPACLHILKNENNCHLTKQNIEEILCNKLIRPISWTSSSHRAIYLDKKSVFLYVKTFFMERLH